MYSFRGRVETGRTRSMDLPVIPSDDESDSTDTSHNFDVIPYIRKLMGLKNKEIDTKVYKYIESFVNKNMIEYAGRLCAWLLPYDSEQWGKWIDIFISSGTLVRFLPSLPFRKDFPRELYTRILEALIIQSPQEFLDLLKDLPSDRYDPIAIKRLISSEMKDQIFVEAKAYLSLQLEQYDEALEMYLTVGCANILQYIPSKLTYDKISNKLFKIAQLNYKKAVKLFADGYPTLEIKDVVEQIQQAPIYLYEYLKQILETQTKEYNQKKYLEYIKFQIEHCIKYDKSSLSTTLESFGPFAFESIYNIAIKNKLDKEAVYILRQMGNYEQSLEIAITKLNDAQLTLDIMESMNKGDIFKKVVDFSQNNGLFLSDLLDLDGYDSHFIISQIVDGVRIPRLKDKLVKVLFNKRVDYLNQKLLVSGTKRICKSQYMKYITTWNHGIMIDPDSSNCLYCHDIIQTRPERTIFCYFCGHFCHGTCYQTEIDTNPPKDSSLMYTCIKCRDIQKE